MPFFHHHAITFPAPDAHLLPGVVRSNSRGLAYAKKGEVCHGESAWKSSLFVASDW
jgi:hypothetical protein